MEILDSHYFVRKDNSSYVQFGVGYFPENLTEKINPAGRWLIFPRTTPAISLAVAGIYLVSDIPGSMCHVTVPIQGMQKKSPNPT